MDYAAFVGTLGIVIGIMWLLAAWLAWRWTWLMGFIKGAVITGFLGVGLLLAAVASDMMHWQKAVEGLTVAHISIDRSSATTPTVSIKEIGNDVSHRLEVNGDFIDLEFHTLRWKSMFKSAGLSYRLAAAQSHFDTIENSMNWSDMGQRNYPLPHQSGWVDIWQSLYDTECGKHLNNFVKAGDLRVNYIPVQDGALFAVVFRDGKLVLEPLNEAAVATSTL